MLRVTAGSRLHFGMLSFGEPAARQFGGAGAMIAAPALRLSIRECDAFDVHGPSSERVKQFIKQLSRRATWWPADAGVRVDVESAPPPHAGLGSGTQLGMALARGLAAFFRAGPQTPEELARAVGRGKRSAVGIHGACSGGLIVEGGKLRQDEISPLVSRVPLCEDWRFALIVPVGCVGLSGGVEQAAFDQLPPVPVATTAALCRELLCGMVPAAVQSDFDRFSDSLYRYGRLAGGCFAAQQGGVYASQAVEHLVERCRALGARGVGQSSWGPTVFALCRRQGEAERLIGSLAAAGDLEQANTVVASPDNHGIQVEWCGF